jgi:hypothetical protein
MDTHRVGLTPRGQAALCSGDRPSRAVSDMAPCRVPQLLAPGPTRNFKLAQPESDSEGKDDARTCIRASCVPGGKTWRAFKFALTLPLSVNMP